MKVTPVSTPEITVTDARGRVLALKKPNVLAQFHLVEMLGATAENRVLLAMVTPLLYLQSIDGEPANFANRREMDAVIQRLDEDGFRALNDGIAEHFSGSSDERAVAKK